MLFDAEVAAAVNNELVRLVKRAGIEEQIDPLAGGELAGRMLPVQSLAAAAQLGPPLQLTKGLEGIHRLPPAVRVSLRPPETAPSLSGNVPVRCQ